MKISDLRCGSELLCLIKINIVCCVGSRVATVNRNIGYPWFRTHGSSFPDFGSVQVCIFLIINVVKTDIRSGNSYKI